MKITYSNGSVQAIAENMNDIKVLMNLNVPAQRVHKPHKKHAFVKQCNLCRRGYKGSRGLGIHMAKCKKGVSSEPKLSKGYPQFIQPQI